MAIELKMPALSPTMEEGTLAKWLVKEGDVVKSGDLLAEIETDKATMEFEAVDEGTITKILVPEGTDGVKVGAAIALLAGEGESSSPSPPTAEAAPPSHSRREGKVPAPESDEPVPHQMETAARELVASAEETEDAPEMPAGTATVSTSVREALRDAMAEEMRRDDRVFVMGEEVGRASCRERVSECV